MKRSKLYLSITAGLLTIAGIAAAKRFGPSKERYYCTINNTCKSAGIFTEIPDPSGAQTAYIQYTIASIYCSAVVYTVGFRGWPCSGIACIHPLTYNSSN